MACMEPLFGALPEPINRVRRPHLSSGLEPNPVRHLAKMTTTANCLTCGRPKRFVYSFVNGRGDKPLTTCPVCDLTAA